MSTQEKATIFDEVLGNYFSPLSTLRVDYCTPTSLARGTSKLVTIIGDGFDDSVDDCIRIEFFFLDKDDEGNLTNKDENIIAGTYRDEDDGKFCAQPVEDATRLDFRLAISVVAPPGPRYIKVTQNGNSAQTPDPNFTVTL